MHQDQVSGTTIRLRILQVKCGYWWFRCAGVSGTTIRLRILQARGAGIMGRNFNNVSGTTIRLRILQGLSVSQVRKRLTVSGTTIRLRILQGTPQEQALVDSGSFRDYDPFEDSARIKSSGLRM